MTPINVVVTAQLEQRLIDRIKAISPDISLTNILDLVRAESADKQAREKLDNVLAEAEVLFGLRLPVNLLSRASKLKWIQVTSNGMDRFLDKQMVESPVIVTNVRGLNTVPVSEFAMHLVLMLAKHASTCFYLQQRKQWQKLVPTTLRSKTIGIVGLGRIGSEVARLAKAFGMTVIATRRSAQELGRSRFADTVFPREKLSDLLRQSDFVILTVPLTAETRGIMGERELRAMKPTAYLINVARGALVDETALTTALEEHWIAGAGLDVFTTEPLPRDSRLWDLPNVIISPHMAGWIENDYPQVTTLFCENLKRYISKRRLLNVVDKKRGY